MLRSPLHDFHVSSGAKMIDFGGWSMPLLYRGITEEHVHTRTHVSVFDVSHMGRYRIDGPDAEALLQRVCTRNLADTQIGQSKYSHVCNESGGIIDDVIVGRHGDHWSLVCNAANRDTIGRWLARHAADHDVNIADDTLDSAMLAIQGPHSVEFVEKTFSVQLRSLKRYHFVDGDFMGMRYSIYRSGYTGEDGVEAVIPCGAVGLLAPMLFGSATADGRCKPAGLGARDTLRLEAAMPLYGHELRDDVDSLTAGQAWCVDLDKDFLGAEALRKIRADGLKRKLVGFELDGKRIARRGYRVLNNGRHVGEVTSGTLSPTLRRSIAMGFLDIDLTEHGTWVSIDLGRRENQAVVVPLPFYKRPKTT